MESENGLESKASGEGGSGLGTRGSKREVEALIDEFARAGMTIVMSTHNLGQVKRLASRVIYLEAGRRVVDWPADRFFTDVLPPEAALFLKGELPWH